MSSRKARAIEQSRAALIESKVWNEASVHAAERARQALEVAKAFAAEAQRYEQEESDANVHAH